MSDTETEIAEIEQVIADSPHSYFRDPALQDRYAELLTAAETGASPPAREAAAIRLGELERLMADGMSEYWRGPQAGRLQREYYSLIEGGERVGADNALGLDQETVTEMQNRIRDAFEGIDDSDLSLGFMGLGENTQRKVVEILADPSRKAEIFDLPSEELDRLAHFVESMSEAEWAACKRCLFL